MTRVILLVVLLATPVAAETVYRDFGSVRLTVEAPDVFRIPADGGPYMIPGFASIENRGDCVLDVAVGLPAFDSLVAKELVSDSLGSDAIFRRLDGAALDTGWADDYYGFTGTAHWFADGLQPNELRTVQVWQDPDIYGGMCAWMFDEMLCVRSDIVSTPEPSAFAGLLAGFGGLLSLRRVGR